MSDELTVSDELTFLEAKVTNAHLDVEIAHDNALDHALKAGAFLLEIINRGLIKHGQRKELFAKTCNSKRTGEVYVQLAENRDLLTEERQTRSSAARLSIRLMDCPLIWDQFIRWQRQQTKMQQLGTAYGITTAQ